MIYHQGTVYENPVEKVSDNKIAYGECQSKRLFGLIRFVGDVSLNFDELCYVPI